MSASPKPNPGPVPIKGAAQPFNTTGYPSPPPQTTDSLVLFPSKPLLEFSIGDLQSLGEFKNIGELVFEIFFTKPKEAELLAFSIEITSPERKSLHTICINPSRNIKSTSRSSYRIFLSEEEALESNKYFVTGNRLVIHAEVAEKIIDGTIQLALRECQ